VWSGALRSGDAGRTAEAAAEIEALGYSAAWIPDVGGELFEPLENLLRATTRLTIATGVLNLWLRSAEETTAVHRRLTAAYGRRWLVGLGVSHAPMIDHLRGPGTFGRPLATTRAYLDELDAQPDAVPASDRVLAALGPKMLELARTRAAGAHPFLVTPQHTAIARQALGPDALLAPEQAVVLCTDPVRARELARRALRNGLLLPNYTNNWKRLGFTDDDLAAGGSDRLVDALVVWGDERAVAARVQEHRDAGADHVCINVIDEDDPLALRWPRTLAPALLG
jgi:probable F420-dependent oxidoreductase